MIAKLTYMQDSMQGKLIVRSGDAMRYVLANRGTSLVMQVRKYDDGRVGKGS